MDERARVPWGWVGFFGALVLLTLLSTAALMKGARELAEREPAIGSEPVWRIIVHGDLHVLEEAEFRAFQERLEAHVDRRLAGLLRDTEGAIDREVERTFAPVYAAIPRYADWYYSLTGEYLRYAHALGSGVADYMVDKLEEILFEETSVTAMLEGLPARLQVEMARRVRRAGEGMLADLAADLEGSGEKAGRSQVHWELAGEIPLDTLVGEELMPSAGLTGRQLFSLGAGAGASVLAAKGGAALLVKKAVAGVAGGKSFKLAASLAGKLATKSALKGGGALAGAGTGTLLCAPGGPLALLCGTGAGVATWLAVDLAALEVDEQLHRETFEREIEEAIRAEEAFLKDSLKRLHASWLKARMDAFRRRAATGADARPGYRPVDALPGAQVSDPGEKAAPGIRPAGAY